MKTTSMVRRLPMFSVADARRGMRTAPGDVSGRARTSVAAPAIFRDRYDAPLSPIDVEWIV